VGKCLSWKTSVMANVLWANVFLGKFLSGQLSYGQMTIWANVLLANVHLGKCISGQMSSGQMSYVQMLFWANVSGQTSLRKCRIGKCRITVYYYYVKLLTDASGRLSIPLPPLFREADPLVLSLQSVALHARVHDARRLGPGHQARHGLLRVAANRRV
jgi:hypothetical protein